jgi:DDE superfamily endonuclease
VAAEPDRYELHAEDETHLETNPYLTRVWHRRGVQPTLPAAGTNRRLTVFGSVELLGRGRVEVLTARQDSAAFARYLAALDARHAATGREIFLALDNGPCHTSRASRAALAERATWLHVIWLAKYSPELNPKEREWRILKRDHRGHLAPALRAFADGILDGLRRLGGERLDIIDEVPDWFLAGHRKPPTGRPRGRPKGAKDSYQRAPYRKLNDTNLPAVA